MLTEELVRRHLTTDREFEDLLAEARSALSHTMPGASELEILKQGLRCIIRDHEKRVQFHHVIDRGKGGPSTVDNLILACAVHNQYTADQTWGRVLMEKFRRARRAQPSSDRSASPVSAGGAMAAACDHTPETG
ncbi:MAG TPA: HNH endonuclease [Polyangia bacterium]|nr:HNH endonuclease [Polyangia bacterium]